MNILAFDTSLGACSAALATTRDGPPKVFGRFELRERQHAETIMPMIEAVLAEASLGWNELDAVAVTSGPGSFTGVRVGVATARGLALALEKPLIAATSLDVMAAQACERLDLGDRSFAVTVDARRGEVYIGLYDAAGTAMTEPVALAPERAAALVASQKAGLLVGSGGSLVRDACPPDANAPEVDLAGLQPDARTLARMALELPPLKEPLRPLYLRPPDAKPQAGKAVERRGRQS